MSAMYENALEELRLTRVAANTRIKQLELRIEELEAQLKEQEQEISFIK